MTVINAHTHIRTRQPPAPDNRMALLKQMLRSDAGSDVLARLLIAQAGGWRLALGRRKRWAGFQLPIMRSAADVPAALAHIRACQERGALTAEDAACLVRGVETIGRTLEMIEMDRRLARLEAGVAMREERIERAGAIAAHGEADMRIGAGP